MSKHTIPYVEDIDFLHGTTPTDELPRWYNAVRLAIKQLQEIAVNEGKLLKND